MNDHGSPPENAILAAWTETSGRLGSAAAILSGRGEVLRTFSDVETEAREWTGVLSAAGPPASGAVVALQTGNRAEFPALLLACWRLGLVPLPLGRHIEPGERALALETCRASLLLETVKGELRLAALSHSAPVWPEPRPEFLKLTSGTTSAPRAIRFRSGQLLADCVNICESMGIAASDLNYGAIPLSHSYGFSNLVTPLLCRGVPVALSEDPLPRAILDGLTRTGATVFPGMPVFFEKLAALGDIQPLGLPPRLRLCISAGAPLPRSVGERFATRFGLRVQSFYGSSECGGIAFDRIASPTGAFEDGCVGPPLTGVCVTPRADGSIEITGDAVADGYWPCAAEPDPTLANGRFIPQDLVRMEAGQLFLAGRVSDVINVAGRKLNPLEVERQILLFPGVRQAVVFGVPSALRNEEPVACVTGDFDPAALLHFLRTALSAWQTPKDIWRVAEIPVNERGKISRRQLAKEYGEIRFRRDSP